MRVVVEGLGRTYRCTGEDELHAEPADFEARGEHFGEGDAEGVVDHGGGDVGYQELHVEFPAHLHLREWDLEGGGKRKTYLEAEVDVRKTDATPDGDYHYESVACDEPAFEFDW